VDEIQAASDENLNVLINDSGNTDYHLRKALERRLAQEFPDYFAMAYVLVAFTNYPFKWVRSRILIQEEIIDELLSDRILSFEDIDWTHASSLILNRLAPFRELEWK
jgi:hypothetical protein